MEIRFTKPLYGVRRAESASHGRIRRAGVARFGHRIDLGRSRFGSRVPSAPDLGEHVGLEEALDEEHESDRGEMMADSNG